MDGVDSGSGDGAEESGNCGQCCALWLAEAFTATHTAGDTLSNRTLHTFLSHLCVYISKAESDSQSDMHVVYMQIMPNCWREGCSPIETIFLGDGKD